MKSKQKMTKKSLQNLEDFKLHWKRIKAIAEPWLLCAGAHDMPETNTDEEDALAREKEWIAKNLIPVALTIGGNDERASIVAKGIKQLLDISTSLRDLGTSVEKKQNFQAQWNYTNNRIGITLSMFEKGADIKSIRKQEEALYPTSTQKKVNVLNKVVGFIVMLLVLWKMLDLAYIAMQVSKYGDKCARASSSQAFEVDCLPNFVPFVD